MKVKRKKEDILCEEGPKKRGVAILISEKNIYFKTKSLRTGKETHFIMMICSYNQEQITL